jgi:hypothetical protein
MINIRTFDAAESSSRDRYRSGILISPLPDADMVLSNRIKEALRAIGISSTQFSITDPNSVPQWCKSVGIEKIRDTSILGIWTDKDPKTCIQVVREVVEEHISNA